LRTFLLNGKRLNRKNTRRPGPPSPKNLFKGVKKGGPPGACPANMCYEVSYYAESYEKMLIEALTPEEAVLKAYGYTKSPYVLVYGHGDYRVIRSLDGQVKVIRQRDWLREN